LALALTACGGDDGGSSEAAATVSGAGSTFQAPIVMESASELKDDGLVVNYNGVGSGAGVTQFTQGTTEIAGSDPPLTAEEADAMKSPPIQIPFALGA